MPYERKGYSVSFVKGDKFALSLGDRPAQPSPRLSSRCWPSVSFTSSQIIASPSPEVLGRDLFTLLGIIFHRPSAWRTEICLVSPIVCSHSQSVYLWALLAAESWRSACAFELCFLDDISTGTRAFNFTASCHQHILLHWIPVAIFQTLPTSITDWVWIVVGSCKHQTVHSSFSSYELYLGFLLSMSKTLACHLLLPLDKLSITQSLPDQLPIK